MDSRIKFMIEDINSAFIARGIGIHVAVFKDMLPSQIEGIWKLCRDASLRQQSEEKVEAIRVWWLEDKRRADEYHEILSDNLLLPGQKEWIESASKDCSCCPVCQDHPCAPTLAGGFCDRMECRCDDSGDDTSDGEPEDVTF